MKKQYSLPLFLLVLTSVLATEQPTEITFTANGKYIGNHDPGHVVIQLDSGEVIDTIYTDIDWKVLSAWEDEDEANNTHRDVVVSYNNKTGVKVYEPTTNTTFRLTGEMDPHPLEIAAKQMKETCESTVSIQRMQRMVLDAWDSELNRIYKELGGNQNEALKNSQLAWIQFRDAEIEYLISEYGSRQGSIWGIVYMDHVISITKEQTLRLQSIKSW